jgi:hypothetical protein
LQIRRCYTLKNSLKGALFGKIEMPNTVFNLQLLQTAHDQLEKAAFVDAAMAGGAAGGGEGGAAPTASPMAGPMPPMPAMGPGDPAAAAPPAAPGVTPEAVQQMIQQAMAGGAAGGAAGAAGAPGQKKKVDVNTEVYQIKKLLVYIMQNMGLSIPPDTLLGDPADDPHIDPNQAAQDPASAAAAPGAMESSIKPMAPMGGASPEMAQAVGGAAEKTSEVRVSGTGFPASSLPTMRNRASALRELIASNAR